MNSLFVDDAVFQKFAQKSAAFTDLRREKRSCYGNLCGVFLVQTTQNRIVAVNTYYLISCSFPKKPLSCVKFCCLLVYHIFRFTESSPVLFLDFFERKHRIVLSFGKSAENLMNKQWRGRQRSQISPFRRSQTDGAEQSSQG